MNIYEKIFARLEELHMSQIELSRRTGMDLTAAESKATYEEIRDY